MELTELKHQLKEQLIDYLNFPDLIPEDIKDNDPFFGDKGLELDSIDSLELIVLLEREYGIKIQNAAEGRKILIDVNHMADYIQEHSK